MPLNEAVIWKRSNLTPAQKREAEAALYGLNPTEMNNPSIEEMRQLVAQHDQQNTRSTGIQQFDINNPPKVPYVHQEFPRVMYHHGKREMRKANNAEEMAEALAAGWKKEPFLEEASAEPVVPFATPELVKRGPGRPKKAQPDEE